MPKSVLFAVVLMAGVTCAAVFAGLSVGHASDEAKQLLYLRFAVVGLLVAGVGLWQVLANRTGRSGSGGGERGSQTSDAASEPPRKPTP